VLVADAVGVFEAVAEAVAEAVLLPAGDVAELDTQEGAVFTSTFLSLHNWAANCVVAVG
jgi:hypothetical protein